MDNLKYTLQGAHIFHWQPLDATSPVLFTSKKALFEKGKAIRGGVPICWPWFGPKEGFSQHGFARTATWELVSDERTNQKRNVVLELNDTDDSLKIFPFKFNLKFIIEEEGNTLKMTLITLNKDNISFKISPALHSYFYVGDIYNTKIDGFKNASFVDKVALGETKIESDDLLQISTETDRIYLSTGTNKIYDSSLNRVITIDHMATATVLWNPWSEKCKVMADIDDDDYKNFVCVETALVPEEVEIMSGEMYSISQTIRCT